MSMIHVRNAEGGQFCAVAPGISLCDLGLGAMTDGAYSLHIVRLDAEGARVEDMHRHEEGFSLAYVLNGWLDVEFQQIGHHRLAPGAVVPAYNGPLHRERDAGDGLELLLLVTPRQVSDDGAQHIVVQQADEAPYRPDSLTGWARRDFDIDAATGGRLSAHGLRALPGAAVDQGWQHSAARYQLLYAVAGAVRIELEHGRVEDLQTGGLMCLPPAHGWRVAMRSDDALLISMALAA